MTTTTTAAREAAKNLAIYNAVADHARHAFEYLNIKPGQYTPAQVVAELKKYRAAWKDNAPAVGDDGGLVRVAVDAFACSFPLLDAFDVLARLATAYNIPTRDRVTFERAAETAPAVVSFMVPTAAADVAKAVAKKAPDREALTFAYIDTERRALVGTDGHVLTVAAVPSLQVAEGARRGYLVARGLLKADRVTIDESNNATDGHNVAESPEWLRFPVWSPVFPDVYDTDALTIDSTTRRALAKAVAAAAKYATPDLKDTRHVAIFGEAGTDRLTIRARREIATPTAEDPHAVKYEYMDTAVQLPATLSRSLAFAFHGPDFATLPAFDTLYITPNEGRAAVVISKRAAAVLISQPLPDGYERICKTDERPAFAVQLHPLADLLDVYTIAPAEVAAPAADLTADTDEPTPAETIESETPATADSEADTLTPDEVRALVAAERERLADTINSDNDPEHATFAAGDVFELLTDTGATVPARVRSLYFNNYDPTAAPCWVYCYDCEPWTDRHGLTIDGGSCDALRMRATGTPAPAADSIESEAETITAAPAEVAAPADSIESEGTDTPTDTREAESEAETIEADPLPLLSIDTAAGVIVWGLADELPTADGLTADTITPADLLTIEAEHADSEREGADRAALLTTATEHADSERERTDRAERRPLLLTIARHALRLAAAAALLLLLTIAPDRAADTLAAPADLTATPAPAADSIEAGIITAADLLTADSEAESRAELADPADSPRPAAERRHARENKRESHARALLTVATADSIAAPAADSIAAPLLTIEADTLTADTLTAAPLLLTADSIEADTLAAQVATLEAPREITAPADTLAAGSPLEPAQEITDTPTADTDGEADITTDDEPTDDTPAAADSESDTDTQTDTAASGHPHAHGSTPATMAAPCSPSAPLAPVAPVLI